MRPHSRLQSESRLCFHFPYKPKQQLNFWPVEPAQQNLKPALYIFASQSQLQFS
ncbi:hypothetical protein SLEP1_g19314 [Rubroshorea leprosula]|nr:hypothetical protein SLEP1_g19314 [Rubroshorea leprosula]